MEIRSEHQQAGGSVFTEADVKTAKQKGKGKSAVEVPSRTIAILIGKQETA